MKQKSSLKIFVEVTDQIRSVRNDGRLQTVFVEAGGKYPVEDSVYIGKGEQPLKAGDYYTDRFYKKGYDWVVSLGDLQPVL